MNTLTNPWTVSELSRTRRCFGSQENYRYQNCVFDKSKTLIIAIVVIVADRDQTVTGLVFIDFFTRGRVSKRHNIYKKNA